MEFEISEFFGSDATHKETGGFIRFTKLCSFPEMNEVCRKIFIRKKEKLEKREKLKEKVGWKKSGNPRKGKKNRKIVKN